LPFAQPVDIAGATDAAAPGPVETRSAADAEAATTADAEAADAEAAAVDARSPLRTRSHGRTTLAEDEV